MFVGYRYIWSVGANANDSGYYYRIKANDSLNNIVITGNYTFNIVIGKLHGSLDQDSLNFCKEREYPIYEIVELRDDVESLFSMLADEANLAPFAQRTELQARLAKIQSACLKDLQ